MKKIIIGVLLIAVICISGTYALLSDVSDSSSETDESTSADLNSDDSVSSVDDSISQSNEINTLTKSDILQIFNLEDKEEYSLDESLSVVIANDSIKSNDLIDRYVQCVVCGGFAPVGPVENPLPSDIKLCNCHEGSLDLVSLENQTYSRDEVCDLHIGLIPSKSYTQKLIGDNPSTLTDFQLLINNAKENSTIVLDNDFVADSNTNKVFIDKHLNIDGGKHVIFGNKTATIYVDSEKVAFSNVTFYDINVKDINSYSDAAEDNQDNIISIDSYDSESSSVMYFVG